MGYAGQELWECCWASWDARMWGLLARLGLGEATAARLAKARSLSRCYPVNLELELTFPFSAGRRSL